MPGPLRAGMAAGFIALALVPAAPTQAGATATARTPLPADRLHFGLGNDPGQESWFVDSGVPWRYRYAYLAGGINTGATGGDPSCGPNAGWQTWNSPAGQYATYYMQNSAAHSAIPVFSYYEIVQSNPSPGSESAELTKISTVCTMQAYWADFTVLMKKAGAFGGQVVVHVEPDFWGFMEHQSSDPSTIPAVVASSGNPDLAGLPNTVQGMGWAFLKLRDLYAPNALLAVHASSWASGVDIASDQRTTVDPNAEADRVASFIEKAGIVGNPAGLSSWDVIFNDVADHDSGFSGIWWDRNNSVFPNFARWLTFMGRLHTDTGLPLVVWQVPVGNQYYRTMNNTAGHYQDNRAEYFLAHPDQLTASGIVAVLFGKANANQTDYTDDAADGVTNPSPISTWQCNLCNSHTSAFSDDDGGYLRAFVGQYYGATPCTGATLSASPPSPSSASPVVWTAAATGCPNPRYRFWERDLGSRWSMVQDYSPSNTYTWNPPPGQFFNFEVDVRDATESVAYDVVRNTTYQRPQSFCGVSPPTLTETPPPPGPTGGAVTFTAGDSACVNPQFRFWIQDPGRRWSMVQDYSSSSFNTHTWAQTGLAGSYNVEVDVREAGETVAYDAVTNIVYAVSGCTTATLTASPSSPQAHGTPTTLTGTANCPGTATYRFWVRAPGGAWRIVRDYGTSNTFVWTPATAGVYALEVDVRDQNATASYEVVNNITFVAS